jgi:hypothetical protein
MRDEGKIRRENGMNNRLRREKKDEKGEKD